jgi:hypothetical protein
MTKTNLLEKDVKAEVKKILNAHEWFWWMPPNNGYGRSGISDFNAIKDHVFMAVETKKKKDMPTAMQTGFLGSIKAMGGFAFCVNERSIDYLDRFLNAYDRSVRATSIQQKPSLDDGAIMLNCIKVMEELWIGGDYASFEKLIERETVN